MILKEKVFIARKCNNNSIIFKIKNKFKIRSWLKMNKKIILALQKMIFLEHLQLNQQKSNNKIV